MTAFKDPYFPPFVDGEHVWKLARTLLRAHHPQLVFRRRDGDRMLDVCLQYEPRRAGPHPDAPAPCTLAAWLEQGYEAAIKPASREPLESLRAYTTAGCQRMYAARPVQALLDLDAPEHLVLAACAALNAPERFAAACELATVLCYVDVRHPRQHTFARLVRLLPDPLATSTEGHAILDRLIDRCNDTHVLDLAVGAVCAHARVRDPHPKGEARLADHMAARFDRLLVDPPPFSFEHAPYLEQLRVLAIRAALPGASLQRLEHVLESGVIAKQDSSSLGQELRAAAAAAHMRWCIRGALARVGTPGQPPQEAPPRRRMGVL